MPVQAGATLVNTNYDGSTVTVGFDSLAYPVTGYYSRNRYGALNPASDFYRQQAISGANQIQRIDAAVPAGGSIDARLYFFDNGGFSNGTYSVQQRDGGALVGAVVTVTVNSSDGPDTAVLTLTDTDNDGMVQVQISTAGGSGYISINGIDVAAVGNLPDLWNELQPA